MATASGKLGIEVPNFSKVILDAGKDAVITAFHKLPYSDTPYYLYGLYVLGGIIVLIILFWWWYNFIR
jgi:hypothetical protein